jgi:hypothetical protein
VSTLRTFFYYLINERSVKTDNPCARFKHLRDAKNKAGRRPPTYNQAQLDALFTHTDEFEKAVFAALLLTGLRKTRTVLPHLAGRGPDVGNSSRER